LDVLFFLYVHPVKEGRQRKAACPASSLPSLLFSSTPPRVFFFRLAVEVSKGNLKRSARRASVYFLSSPKSAPVANIFSPSASVTPDSFLREFQSLFFVCLFCPRPVSNQTDGTASMLTPPVSRPWTFRILSSPHDVGSPRRASLSHL